MPIKPQQRTLNTLRTILIQHKVEGKLPHLTAVATIFTNLLSQSSSDDAWQLFHEVASLPLMSSRLEVRCVAEGQACEMRRRKGFCGHGQIDVPFALQLDSVDHHLFDKGRRINGPQAMSWWGRQLAQALGGVAV
jgi:hypothetical protein